MKKKTTWTVYDHELDRIEFEGTYDECLECIKNKDFKYKLDEKKNMFILDFNKTL